MIVGIDPGVNTGLAISVDGKLTELIQTDFWGAVDIINDNPDAVVVVELPKTKHVWHGSSTHRGAIQRTGVNVGSVIRESELLVEYLKRNGRTVYTVSPKGKLNHEQFCKITGWTDRTTQHKRDAAMLIYGTSYEHARI